MINISQKKMGWEGAFSKRRKENWEGIVVTRDMALQMERGNKAKEEVGKVSGS